LIVSGGIQHHVTAVLERLNALGGYRKALVCTDDGLLIAAAGSSNGEDEDLAAFASLFDTVLARARLDLGFEGIDEVTLLDPAGIRLVVRPIPETRSPRMFLVVRLERTASWRRNTTQACARLAELLGPFSLERTDVERMAV
jgi:hypothetical protein